MSRRTLPSLLAALLLLPLAAGSQGTPPPPPPPPPPSATPAPPPPPPGAATAPQDDDDGWPRSIVIDTGTVMVYQPQFEKLEGATVTGRSAFSWEPKGQAPTFGVFWFKAGIMVDKATNATDLESLKVTKVRFPNLTPELEAKAVKLFETEIPKWDISGTYTELQASLAASLRETSGAAGIKATPPRLLFAREATVLLLFDGKPVPRAIPNSTLERVLNTTFFVVRDPATSRFYLSGGDIWFEATDPMGPWQAVPAPSPAVNEYFAKNPPPPPKDEPKSAEAGQPPAPPAARPAPAGPPKIIVATEPTELIVFDGAPNYVPVGGQADLLFADNSDGKVLVHVPTNETYVLVSGRWFKARSLDGPWEAVRPDKLPAAFAAIPVGSSIDDVRTFVAGTDEANDALADTQIPQTTAVKRDQTITVTYDGEPKFKPIEGTAMSFATNTSFSVIQEGGRYYCCHQAVWYVAGAPKGPWAVSDKRPPSIEKIPPEVPVYNVRYVEVYQSTPQVVYVGYLPGYVGVYPYYGTVVYGTGWYYPPYVSPYAYYGYPATFGVRVTWNPWGGFGVGVGWSTPYMSVGIHFGGYGGFYGAARFPPPYRPPYGYRPPPPGYRPPAGARPPAGGARPPGARPPTAGTSPSTRPATGDNVYNRAENSGRNVPRDAAAAQRPGTPTRQPNNVYADKSGNVYRQNQGGGWEQNTKQGWQGQSGGGAGGARPATTPSGGGGSRPSTSPSPSTRPSAPSGLGSDAAARGRSAGSGRGGGGGGRGGGRR